MLMTAKGTRKYNALYKTVSEVVRNIQKETLNPFGAWQEIILQLLNIWKMFAQLFSKCKPAQKPTTLPVNQIFRHFLCDLVLFNIMYVKRL